MRLKIAVSGFNDGDDLTPLLITELRPCFYHQPQPGIVSPVAARTGWRTAGDDNLAFFSMI